MSGHPLLTSLFNEGLAGDAASAERAWSEVYGELRSMAAAAIARETGANAAGRDLDPTGVVHEIFLRIGRSPPPCWESRRHFFGAASQACSQILVDLARARRARKRGGGREAVPLTFVAGELEDARRAFAAADLGLAAALERLGNDHARAAEVARLRYVIGLGTVQVATLLGVSPSTVEKDWAFARAWLRRELDSAA